MNVIIFGTGLMYQKYSEQLEKNKFNIVAFVENDKSKVGLEKDGRPIIDSTMIKEYNYDYILIMSSYWMQIEPQLVENGIKKEKIIIPYPLSNSDEKLNTNNQLDDKIEKLKSIKNKKKIAVIVDVGDNRFIKKFYNHWREEYEVIEFKINNFQAMFKIDEILQNSDICFFEWAGSVLAYASNLDAARTTKIICRIHRYEVFSSILDKVKWENVDRAIFIAEHIRRNFIEYTNVEVDKTGIIYNGFNLEEFAYTERGRGYNIAYLGTLIYRKAPNMMLQILKQLVDIDKRYTLHFTGAFDLKEVKIYCEYMAREMGIEKNIVYHSFQDSIDAWLEDMNYILCTSVSEGHIGVVQEAMIKGIKPIIHNYPGAKEIYNSDMLWNTIDEAVNMINDEEYDSRKYREIIEKDFELTAKAQEFKKLFDEIYKRR